MIFNGKSLDEHNDEGNPMTDEEFKAAEHAMTCGGRTDGRSAAGWLLDGNSTKEAAQEILRKIENCELDTPNPLSGEWADDPTLGDLIHQHTDCCMDSLTDGELDCLATAYEDGFAEGYHMEAERIARFYAKG